SVYQRSDLRHAVFKRSTRRKTTQGTGGDPDRGRTRHPFGVEPRPVHAAMARGRGRARERMAVSRRGGVVIRRGWITEQRSTGLDSPAEAAAALPRKYRAWRDSVGCQQLVLDGNGFLVRFALNALVAAVWL